MLNTLNIGRCLDGCLSYEDNQTKTWCNKCDDQYVYFMVNPTVQLCALKGAMMTCDVSPWNTVNKHNTYYQEMRYLSVRYTSDSMFGDYYYCYHVETYWKRTAYKTSCNAKNIMNT